MSTSTPPLPGIDPKNLQAMVGTKAGRKAIENHLAFLSDARREYVGANQPRIDQIREMLRGAQEMFDAHVARIDHDLRACESALGSTGELAA